MKKTYPIVEIHWLDAHSHGGWNSDGEVPNTLAPCTSVGIEAALSKDAVTICGAECEGDWNDVQVIPRKMIVSRKVLTHLVVTRL